VVATVDGSARLTSDELKTLQLLRRAVAHGFGLVTVSVQEGRPVTWTYQETHRSLPAD